MRIVTTVLLAAWGCGGSVIEGSAGTAGSSGAAASPGSGGSGASGGVAGAGHAGTPASGGTAGAGGAVGTSCATVCAKLNGLGYYTTDDCVGECELGRKEAVGAGCGDEFDALVSCMMGAEITCDAQGDPKILGCDGPLAAYQNCISMPPDPCGAIPDPIGTLPCNGTMDPNGKCVVECKQGQNVWGAECSGGTCMCRFNGQVMCMCAGSCSESCCPGT